MATNNKNDIGKLLSKYGYSAPLSEDEILSFEKKFKNDYEVPKNWSSINEIISGEVSETKDRRFIENKENSSIYPLSMAAREGNKITEETRKRMNQDKKDAQK